MPEGPLRRCGKALVRRFSSSFLGWRARSCTVVCGNGLDASAARVEPCGAETPIS